MRVLMVLPGLIVIAALADCGGSDLRAASEEMAAVPAAVNCGDAPQLSQRAAEDRQRVIGSRSDHERIATGSRANFLSSLAVIANLKCRDAGAAVDDSLNAALAAARNAAATKSVYEKTRGYQEATFLATRVIETMTASAVAPAK